MTTYVWENHPVVTRAPHPCVTCDATTVPGDRAMRSVGLEDAFYSEYRCGSCPWPATRHWLPAKRTRGTGGHRTSGTPRRVLRAAGAGR